jgi:hypothetical protein
MDIVPPLAWTGGRTACASIGRARAGSARPVVATDHAIATTGYKVDLRRLSFLDKGMQPGLRMANYTPILSPNFESSVPDLYFVGLAAANTFGPVMPFLLGARYTARRLTRHLSQPVAAQ